METISQKLDAAFPRKVVKMPLFGPDNIPSPHYGICFEDATSREDWVKATVKQGYQLHTREDVKSICLAVAEGFDIDPDHINVKASWVKGKGHAVHNKRGCATSVPNPHDPPGTRRKGCTGWRHRGSPANRK